MGRLSLIKWKWLYFCLALFNLIFIKLSAYVNYNLSQHYNKSVSVNEFWASRLKSINSLQSIAAKIDVPGNNIFETENIKLEEEKLNLAVAEYKKDYNQIAEGFESIPISEFNQKVNLEVVNNEIEKMIQLNHEVLSHFSKNNKILASKKMALLDQTYYKLRELLGELEDKFRTKQEDNLKIQKELGEDSRKLEVIFSISMLVIIIAIFAYGIVISKFIEAAFINSRLLEEQKNALDSAAIVAITDLKGKIKYANDKFSEISGYSKEELLNQDHRIVNSKYHNKEFFENMWATINSGRVWKGEIKNKNKNGSEYWVDTTIIPTKKYDGKIWQFVSIRFDITKRKLSESLQLAQQKELDQFFELSQDLLCVVGADGKFKKINNSFTKILGYGQEQLISKLFMEFVHKDDLFATLTELEKLNQGARAISFYNRYKKMNGEYIHFSWGATQGSDGKIYAIARDITAQTDLEYSLIKAKEEAETASKTKAQFLANMSHEIRTPMNGIIGMTNLLLSSKMNSEDTERLKIIQNCGNSLLDLVNDVLDFSKLEVNKVELETQPYGLHETVNEVLGLLRTRADEKNTTVVYRPDDGVPDWIAGDVTRFRQILTNLVSNAIKFTDKGQVEIFSSVVHIEPNKWRVYFSVKDSGIGVPENVKDKLFRSFSQVDASTTRKYGGSGLGLTICKGLCEKMGGKVWLENSSSKGSTFSFYFLADEYNGIKKEVSQNPFAYIDSEMAKTHPLRILVAEDNRTNQLVALGILGKLGYRADIAANGREVLDCLERQSYDLIFMDCHMPEIDGFEATEKIVEKYEPSKRPRIIAMTASTLKEDIERATKCGMNGFIAKPVSLQELVKNLVECQPILTHSDDKKTLSTESFDKVTFLNNFLGMEDLTGDIIDSFIKALPNFTSNIQLAIENKNPKELEVFAHCLKGALSNFYAERAQLLAWKLEQLGNGSFDEAISKKIFDELKIELAKLSDDLLKFSVERRAA